MNLRFKLTKAISLLTQAIKIKWHFTDPDNVPLLDQI